ncbi:topoisomerase II-associated protein PAT1 [Infundibulicybe gibba]|nr:topoisomerase II-associated protein PAT1 [Infundibulicybe gibba]
MAFFGLEQNDLEQGRREFLGGDRHESEDVAVYTWGEDSYDGLGDALQEGGDELNDETFGGSGVVGKDFDFSNPVLPDHEHQQRNTRNDSHSQQSVRERPPQQHVAPISSEPLRSNAHSLEAIWDDRSPFSVLPRTNGAGRPADYQQRDSSSSRFSPFPTNRSPALVQQPMTANVSQVGRTLEEIEAEMHAAAQQTRTAAQRRQQQLLLLQQQQEEEELRFQQQQELDYQRQLLQYQQEQQHQLQVQRLLQQQQFQQQNDRQRTPPPRMHSVSQSPRFFEHQRQLLLQQQQELLQQQRLQDLQEQLRMEELERQMRTQLQLNQPQDRYSHQRQPSGPTITEIQAAHLLQQHQQQNRQRSHSPAVGSDGHFVPQDGLPYISQNVQMQQRLLSEMAQADFMREMSGASQVEQDALRAEAMRKIVEAEKMEEKRRRKAAKIAHMARYNDLMTQSDKDFITRIQVSQLVTQDPYAEDFYAQVYGAILRSRMGLQSQDERVLKFGSGGGVGLGLPQKGNTRRPNAMQRMEQQVERIVSNARRREEEKGIHSLHSLQGALGKTSGRSYKAAPRQLLQVDGSNSTASPTLSHAHAQTKEKNQDPNGGAAQEAAKLGREALGNAAGTGAVVRRDPLTQREVLVILEQLYDLVLKVEQLRRDQPHPEDAEPSNEWQEEYENFDGPLDTSNPHPFVSLLTPSKGKKLLPRLTRHLDGQRMLTMLTFLVACFAQLDVVKQAPLLDSVEDTAERGDVERQTQAFLGSVLQSILPVVAKASLRLVTGLLGLLLDRSNIVMSAQTRPGLALLTLFLSRVEVIRQSMNNPTEVVTEAPAAEDLQQWQLMFDHLFQLLSPHFLQLFPTIRIAPALPAGSNLPSDLVDQPVWQFLAALALHATTEQHEILVTVLREKVLENVVSANHGWVADEEERQTKLANVNLFLHALGLDSSQIAL